MLPVSNQPLSAMRALISVVILSSHSWLTQADEHGCHCGPSVPEVSNGPSNGPSDRLLTTEEETEEEETEEECICPDPVPGVVSSFSSTLSFADPSQLANLDIDAMKDSLIASQDWGDHEVVATAVFGVKVTYSLPAEVEFTLDECAAVWRGIHSVPAANDVICSTGTTTDRRLQDTADIDVAMSYPDATAASTASTGVAAMTDEDLISNLAAAGGAIATISQTAPSVDVDIDWVVTGEALVVAPVVDDLIAAAGDDVTITVVVTEVAVTYTAMPCSVGLESESCPTGLYPVDSPASVGCSAATCDLADADTQCCVTASPASTSSASTNTQAMGSLMVLFPVVWLWL